MLIKSAYARQQSWPEPFLSSLSSVQAVLSHLWARETFVDQCYLQKLQESFCWMHIFGQDTSWIFCIGDNFPNHSRTLRGKCKFISNEMNWQSSLPHAAPQEMWEAIQPESNIPAPNHPSLEVTGCLPALNWPKLPQLHLILLLSEDSLLSPPLYTLNKSPS